MGERIGFVDARGELFPSEYEQLTVIPRYDAAIQSALEG